MHNFDYGVMHLQNGEKIYIYSSLYLLVVPYLRVHDSMGMQRFSYNPNPI